jgi:5'-nucleotidase / UDP-sugar diphosphatase
MRPARTLFRSIVLALFLAGAAFAQATKTVTILHLNDTHSNLSPIGPRDAQLRGMRGGIARMATLIQKEKAGDAGAIVLHAGDSFIGDLFFNTTYGVGELSLLHAIGVNAMAVGNHEFDLGPSTLLGALGAAFGSGGFPLLSANLLLPDPSVQPLSAYVFPSATFMVDGVKVGVFGLTTPETNILSQPSPAVINPAVLQSAQIAVASLQAQGCAVILCLSHMGIAADRDLAYALPQVHAFIGGHDHLWMPAPEFVTNANGGSTPLVQAGSQYAGLGRLRFDVSGTNVSFHDYALLPVDDQIAENPAITGAVDGMIANIEGLYGPVYSLRIVRAADDVDEVAAPWTRLGAHDTPAGNLVTDAFRSAMGTDIAVCAGGSLAQPLYRGPLVGADVFRMLGYGFNMDNGLGYRMATFKITGASLLAGLELGVAQAEHSDELLIQVSGMTYDFCLESVPMHRIRSVKIGKHPLDPDHVYTVASNEFVPMFMTALGITVSEVRVVRGLSEFEVVAADVAQRGVITPGQSGRVKRVNVHAPKEAAEDVVAPGAFSIEQNYPNPFNPSTTIAFTLAAPSPVTLRVYDMRGVEVAAIVDGPLDAGRHVNVFNADRLPSGVYHAILRVGNRTAVRAMTLAK